MILDRSFFQRSTLSVAKDLLGKVLVHNSSLGVTSGLIVETEAYLGPEDQAAHSSGGKRTARNEVMFQEKGYTYVYFIYGLYHCFNITTGNVSGKPEAVLIRAIQPLEGVDLMFRRRSKIKKIVNLANGPSKLCLALDITKKHNKHDLTVPPLYLKDAPSIPVENIIQKTRIGIDYSGQWKNKLWRFYIKENKYISKK
ncbi:MAG: DNA-3-methyladenine glycosylase [Candidatus Bathyarchaeota archaeon]